jgi:hypothetical protein
MQPFDNPEVIFNFWYVHDEDGYVFSLRARAYIGLGSDEQKLALLKAASRIDYLIAKPYPIPEKFHINVANGSNKQKLPVFHVNLWHTLDSPLALFEDAIRDIEDGLPAQSNLKVNDSPLTCTTPLLGDEEGRITLVIKGSQTYDDVFR